MKFIKFLFPIFILNFYYLCFNKHIVLRTQSEPLYQFTGDNKPEFLAKSNSLLNLYSYQKSEITKSCTITNKVEYVILLDESLSVGPYAWNRYLIPATLKIVNHLKKQKTSTPFTILKFSNVVDTYLRRDESINLTLQQIIDKVSVMSFGRGPGTYTGDAVAAAKLILDQSTGTNAYSRIIMITDGVPQLPTQTTKLVTVLDELYKKNTFAAYLILVGSAYLMETKDPDAFRIAKAMTQCTTDQIESKPNSCPRFFYSRFEEIGSQVDSLITNVCSEENNFPPNAPVQQNLPSPSTAPASSTTSTTSDKSTSTPVSSLPIILSAAGGVLLLAALPLAYFIRRMGKSRGASNLDSELMVEDADDDDFEEEKEQFMVATDDHFV